MTESSPQPNLRILLAEDDHDMRRFLAKALRTPVFASPPSTMGFRPIIGSGRNRLSSS